MELQWAIERLSELSGELVQAQLLSRSVDPVPLAELSGVLTVDASLAVDEPRVLGLNGHTIWIWPARFVEANPIASKGALELVTQDVTVIVGPADRDWID